jgi:maltooligosyltrehalose trehalohydrolase
MLIDPSTFQWTDAGWRGADRKRQVIYELHVGTFTQEGTWRSAAERLPFLRDLGITMIEMMPVAEFPGAFGWGYDGVGLWAPCHLYGTPDDLRHFVDEAHRLELAVILDVVYNHLGPNGNYLTQFASDYFTDRYTNEWGAALNFDGENAIGVREYFVENAAHWIDEYHFDGLRLDATQSIHDFSGRHVLAEIAEAARKAAKERTIYLVAENEPQDAKLVRDYGLDALWNDDFHHSAQVALSGRSPAYYSDHHGRPQEFISAAKWGFLFQGQHYSWQKERRGAPALDLDAANFVCFLENHDQVANSAWGQRLVDVSSPATLRAMTALLLLGPATPMLFQGQEFGSTAPFLYFADHEPELAKLVAKGRREFLRQFPTLKTKEMQKRVPDPSARETFERCKLDWNEAEENPTIVALHRDLMQLRQSLPLLADQRADLMHGCVLSPEAFALRWISGTTDDLLLLINLGSDVCAPSFAEPLVASPTRFGWETLWSSEDPEYGGCGRTEPESKGPWNIAGRSATLLRPRNSELTK